eukprot:GCRY01003287.1.p1 GENE.GCRY01003287.1~~GCRY01003287.1.p1  ORF type:complete len:556 (-),score=142.03 GCRY01003287.1:37-1704(-)
MADQLKAQGNKAFQSGDFDSAIELFSKAIEIAPTNHVLYSNRSGAYASKKDYQKALEDAEKCVSINPNWAKGYSRKATALRYLGKIEEASETVLKGLDVEPNNAALLQAKEELASSMNPFGQMFKPENLMKFASHPQISKYLLEPDFIQMCNELRQSPDAINKYMSDPRVMAVLSASLGIDLSAAGAGPMETEPQPEPKKEEAPKKEPEPEPVVPEEEMLSEEEKQEREQKAKAEAVKTKGNEFYKKKSFEEALKCYSEAIELDETNMLYLLNRSAVHLEMGSFDKGISDANKALDVGRAHRTDFKNIAKAYVRLGNAYVKKNELETACHMYEKALSEHRTADTLNKLRKAENDLRVQKAREYEDPELAEAERKQGNEKFGANDFPGAIRHYDEAIKRNPRDCRTYSNRAACYLKLAEPVIAAKDADKCIELDPTFIKGYLRKGMCHFMQKEYHKCLEIYDEGLKIDEHNQELRDAKQQAVMAIMRQQREGPDAEAQARAMNDPEIQKIMKDPVFSQNLQAMQQNPQEAMRLQQDPDFVSKLNKLIAAGLIKVGE